MIESVTIRDLRNNSAEVLARVAHGESLVVTKDGDPVAQVTPLPKRRLSTVEVQRRLTGLPPVDFPALRREIDDVIDPALRLTGDSE